MTKHMYLSLSAVLLAGSSILFTGVVHADLMQDVKDRGVLRCGVMLDFPPAGFRNKDNEPAGFDVDYCGDLASKIGVEYEVVETPSPDRIPALVSGRVDVSVAGASLTPERAQTINFSRPYAQYPWVVVTKEGKGINAFEDVQNYPAGGVRGTYPEILLKDYAQANWGDGFDYKAYNSDSEQNLALKQDKVDSFVTLSTAAAAVVGLPQFSDFKICCDTPFSPDIVGLMVRKGEDDFLEYVNNFIADQVGSERYSELYKNWYNLKAPDLPETAAAVLNRTE